MGIEFIPESGALLSQLFDCQWPKCSCLPQERCPNGMHCKGCIDGLALYKSRHGIWMHHDYEYPVMVCSQQGRNNGDQGSRIAA